MYNEQYISGLTLDVVFEFKDISWLVVDKTKTAYMLTHFNNKRTHHFKKINWTLNKGMIGFWYCRKFYSKKSLNELAVKVNKQMIIFESKESYLTPDWVKN